MLGLWKLAWRNIFRQKRRSLLTGMAMVVGFVLMSLNMSIIDGTFGDAVNAFTRAFTGHVQVFEKGYLDHPGLYETLTGADALGGKIAAVPYVTGWAPRLYSGALAFIGKKTTSARIIGIDPEREFATTTWTRKLTVGKLFSSPTARSVMIAGGLADLLGAKVGDPLVLIAQAADGSIANDIFNVAAIVTGGKDAGGSHNCYLPLATAQEFLALPGQVHEIVVMLQDYSQAEKGARDIAARLRNPNLEVQPWQLAEPGFYKMVQSKRQGSAVIWLIVFTIVALGLLNTVLMSILERTHEFGVLKALGTRNRVLAQLIVMETACLSLVAVAAGLVISSGLDLFFAVHGVRYPQPMDVGGVILDKVSGVVTIGVLAYPALLTLVVAVIVSIFPAVRAARMKPVEALNK